MYLKKILLENFRSYPHQLFEFDPKTNLILGPNGSGKTNILEAIYLLSSGKSFRSSSLPKLINWNSNICSIRSKLEKSGEEIELEVQLIKEEPNSSVKRKFILDKVEKTA